MTADADGNGTVAADEQMHVGIQMNRSHVGIDAVDDWRCMLIADPLVHSSDRRVR